MVKYVHKIDYYLSRQNQLYSYTMRFDMDFKSQIEPRIGNEKNIITFKVASNCFSKYLNLNHMVLMILNL